MTEKEPTANPAPQPHDDDEYMRRGKGREDEIGHAGIDPASAPDAPADAEIRSPGEIGHQVAAFAAYSSDRSRSITSTLRHTSLSWAIVHGFGSTSSKPYSRKLAITGAIE